MPAHARARPSPPTPAAARPAGISHWHLTTRRLKRCAVAHRRYDRTGFQPIDKLAHTTASRTAMRTKMRRNTAAAYILSDSAALVTCEFARNRDSASARLSSLTATRTAWRTRMGATRTAGTTAAATAALPAPPDRPRRQRQQQRHDQAQYHVRNAHMCNLLILYHHTNSNSSPP